MRDYFIYVALSECKTITKVGMSTGVSTRMAGLKLSEGQSFKPLFISAPKSKKEALEIEVSVNNKFKKDIIKGNEWYKTKPILIIEYLMQKLNLQPHTIMIGKTDYPTWESNVNDYRNGKEVEEYPLIKVQPNNGIYTISYLFGDEIKYISFCNFGDARKFYREHQAFILTVTELKESLYNLYKGHPLNLMFHTKSGLYSLRKDIISVKQLVDNLL